MKKNLVLIYGYGGHEVEMRYLCESINLKNKNVVIVREEKSRLIDLNGANLVEDIQISRLREYYSNSFVGSVFSILKSFYIFFYIFRKYRRLTFISTGPGFCLPFLFGSRTLGTKFLYFENSCRFHMKSYTGIFCNFLADFMFVQNIESKSIYPNAIFCGQLMSNVNNCSSQKRTDVDILVTVGSTLFDELFDQVDSLSDYIRNRITCQVGPSKKKPKVSKVIDFVDNIEDYYRSSQIVICHAGAGTVFRLLELEKKIIVVPNISRTDKHQLDLAQYVEDNNLGHCLKDFNTLEDTIARIGSLVFYRYKPKKFFMKKYLNSLL
jgi:beta-1,4-N-acetylglucosaminyltransferase